MAGFHIHLAITKRYIDKNADKASAINDLPAFYDGSLTPDFVKDKSTTHYGEKTENYGEDLYNRVNNYVNISKYLKENQIKTDFDRGFFLHLITDHMFFTEFFNAEYLKSRQHKFFIADLYHSYDKTNPYIWKTYNFDALKKYVDFNRLIGLIKESVTRKITEKDYTPLIIFNEADIDAFIEEVSSVDLESISELFRKSLT